MEQKNDKIYDVIDPSTHVIIPYWRVALIAALMIFATVLSAYVGMKNGVNRSQQYIKELTAINAELFRELRFTQSKQRVDSVLLNQQINYLKTKLQECEHTITEIKIAVKKYKN